jgi:hypothetical protein
MKVQILKKNKAVMPVRGKHFPTCIIHDFTVTDIFLYQIRHSEIFIYIYFAEAAIY